MTLRISTCPDARIGASREVVLAWASSRHGGWCAKRTPGSLFWVERDYLARRTVPGFVNRKHLTEVSGSAEHVVVCSLAYDYGVQRDEDGS